MAAEQVAAVDKNISMVALGVEPVKSTDEGFWNWVDHRLDDTLGANPHNIYPAMAGPPQMNTEFGQI